MTLLKQYFILITAIAAIPQCLLASDKDVKNPQTTGVEKNDDQSELLDKEYGVRYASACEGKYWSLDKSDVNLNGTLTTGEQKQCVNIYP